MKVMVVVLLLGAIGFLIFLLGKCMCKGIREKEEKEDRMFRSRGRRNQIGGNTVRGRRQEGW